MAFWIAIVLGIIQGLTEFLPVSSSGHLVVFEYLFDINFDYTFLNVILHVATLLSVILFYRKKIWYLITHPFCKTNIYLICATIPAVIFVLLFNSIIDNYCSNISFVGIGFIVTSILLFISQKTYNNYTKPQELNIKNTFLMGIGQAFAVFPGLSRSGTTLSIGLCSGLQKQSALDFSFLMSIPIIIASIVFEICFKNMVIDIIDILPITFAFISAMITALLGLKFMQKLIQKINLTYFIIYLILLGAIVIII